MNLLISIVGRLPRRWIIRVSELPWRYPWFKRVFKLMADRFRHQDGWIQQGAGQGLRFNPGPSNVSYLLGTTEPDVQEALASLLRTGMTMYDVGANVGFLSMIAARLVGTKGRVVCFEPVAGNARWIRHNAGLNGFPHVRVFELALGGEDRRASFLVSEMSTTGRLEGYGGPNETKRRNVVQVRRLDSLIREQDLPSPDFIKIDVEGAETEVLAGAAGTIRSARPLLFIELHGTNKPVAQALQGLGYSHCVLGDARPMTEVSWDAHVIAFPKEQGRWSEREVRQCAGAASRGGDMPPSRPGSCRPYSGPAPRMD